MDKIFQQLRDKHPAVYADVRKWWHNQFIRQTPPRQLVTRDLYDFFDERGIKIVVSHFPDGWKTKWGYEIHTELGFCENQCVKSRQDAEQEAFLEAAKDLK